MRNIIRFWSDHHPSNFNFVYFRAMSKDRGLFRTTGSFAAIVPDVRIRQNSPLSHPPWNVSNVQRDLSCLTQPCSTIQTTNWMGKALMKTDNTYMYMYDSAECRLTPLMGVNRVITLITRMLAVFEKFGQLSLLGGGWEIPTTFSWRRGGRLLTFFPGPF